MEARKKWKFLNSSLFIFIHKCVHILSIYLKHNLKQDKYTVIGLMKYQEDMYISYSILLALLKYN